MLPPSRGSRKAGAFAPSVKAGLPAAGAPVFPIDAIPADGFPATGFAAVDIDRDEPFGAVAPMFCFAIDVFSFRRRCRRELTISVSCERRQSGLDMTTVTSLELLLVGGRRLRRNVRRNELDGIGIHDQLDVELVGESLFKHLFNRVSSHNFFAVQRIGIL